VPRARCCPRPANGHVGPGGRVSSRLDDGHEVQRTVEPPITTSVRSMTLGLPGRDRDWGGSRDRGVGGLRAEAQATGLSGQPGGQQHADAGQPRQGDPPATTRPVSWVSDQLFGFGTVAFVGPAELINSHQLFERCATRLTTIHRVILSVRRADVREQHL
jgi:hypothetical protein